MRSEAQCQGGSRESFVCSGPDAPQYNSDVSARAAAFET